MKTHTLKSKNQASWRLVFTAVLSLAQFPALATVTAGMAADYNMLTVADGTNAGAIAVAGVKPGKPIIIGAIEPFGSGERLGQRETTWLGVDIEEAPEALTAQLRLDPGVGLVVTYVVTNSPAAKAGLQKNDVLVEFEGQSLVHPMQLRKLIQVRKEGDTVKLVFYRGGKKETVTATLARSASGFGLPSDSGYGDIFRQFGDRPGSDAFREQMKALREQMGNVKIDQKELQAEINRSMGEARKAYQDALRQATNAKLPLGLVLQDLARMGAAVNNDASVTVRSTGRSSRSLVKADDAGTIVLVKNPKLYLTAHDKDGKLLFDGEIETPEQRNHVPRELWQKVEPLLKDMNSNAGEPPAAGFAPSPDAALSDSDGSAQ